MSKIKEGYKCEYYERVAKEMVMYTLDKQLLIGGATRQVGQVFSLTPAKDHHYEVYDANGFHIGIINKDLLVYFTKRVIRHYDTL